MSDPPTTALLPSSTPHSPSSSPPPPSFAVSCVDAASTSGRVFDVATSVICALYLTLGLVFILFGYRLFKMTLFCFGFLLGAVSLFAICQTKVDFLGRVVKRHAHDKNYEMINTMEKSHDSMV